MRININAFIQSFSFRPKFKFSYLPLLLSLYSSVFAGNYAVNNVAARAGSVQAFTAIADDGSAIYYNPAGITQIKGTVIENVVLLIDPNQTYRNAYMNDITESSVKAIGPNTFITTDYFKKITLGIGIYAPFARESEYGATPGVYHKNNYSKMFRIDTVPTVAIALSDNVSIGGGLVLSHIWAKSDILGLWENTNGWGATGQGGVLVKLPQNIKVGATYRGGMHRRLHGHGKLGMLHDNFSSKFTFPAVFSAGISWEALNQVTLSFAYDREYWHTTRAAVRTYNDPVLNSLGTTVLNAKDSDNYRAGIMYRPNALYELRAGFTHSGAALPALNIVPAQPDYDINYVSAGFSRYAKGLRVDMGFELGHANERKSNNPIFPGTYHAYTFNLLAGIAFQVA